MKKILLMGWCSYIRRLKDYKSIITVKRTRRIKANLILYWRNKTQQSLQGKKQLLEIMNTIIKKRFNRTLSILYDNSKDDIKYTSLATIILIKSNILLKRTKKEAFNILKKNHTSKQDKEINEKTKVDFIRLKDQLSRAKEIIRNWPQIVKLPDIK